MGYGSDLQHLLGMRRSPIAVGFFDRPPQGIEPWTGPPVPAGCSFWDKAMSGATFYTRPADHYNCAIGCYTHNIALPPERSVQLDETIGLMVKSEYLAVEEVAGIPTFRNRPVTWLTGPSTKPPSRPPSCFSCVTPSRRWFSMRGRFGQA